MSDASCFRDSFKGVEGNNNKSVDYSLMGSETGSWMCGINYTRKQIENEPENLPNVVFLENKGRHRNILIMFLFAPQTQQLETENHHYALWTGKPF